MNNYIYKHEMRFFEWILKYLKIDRKNIFIASFWKSIFLILHLKLKKSDNHKRT